MSTERNLPKDYRKTTVLAVIYFSVIAIPLLMGYFLHVPFSLIIDNPQLSFTLSVFTLLAIVAPYIYISFQQESSSRMLLGQREQFNALKKITQGSLEIEDLSHLLKIIPNFLLKMYRTKLNTVISQAAVYFYDNTTDSFIMVAQRGKVKPLKTYLTTQSPLVCWLTVTIPYLIRKKYFKPEELEVLRVKDIDYFLSMASLVGREPKIKEVLIKLKEEFQQLGASLCVPCSYQKEYTGFLILGQKKCGEYNAEEISALTTVSNHIAMAIRSAKLRQDLVASYLEAIKGIVKSLEARDPYTKGHSERVVWYSLAIASELKDKFPFSQIPGFLEKVQQAALLHDVGKIGIRDNILLKPEALTSEENEIVAQHPKISEHILMGLKGISQDVLAGVKYHHERYDGTGYCGLKGGLIPPIARILAVADSYDAMTTDRPYRRALSDNETLKEIIKSTYYSGPQWDPIVVEALLNAFKKGMFKKEAIITQKEIEQMKKELAEKKLY